MKPTLPKGTRDFAPEQVLKRDHIFSIIRKTFAAYGYAPIETPAMESLSTLTGKYGEEGDKLLFKVLNNGDFWKKTKDEINFYQKIKESDFEKFFDSIRLYVFEKIFIKTLTDSPKLADKNYRLDHKILRKEITLYVEDFFLKNAKNEFQNLKEILIIYFESDNRIFEEIRSIRNNITLAHASYIVKGYKKLLLENHKLFSEKSKKAKFNYFYKVQLPRIFSQITSSSTLIPALSKRGLRYDLTVPFARFVSMHRNDLQFPFKRYQVQPVWRADRPQKGRYQEFYQCDADVVGSDSLIYECEFIQIFDTVFSELNLKVKIRYNHRQILLGVAQYAGIEDKFVEMTTSLDKLDKIGEQGVLQELDYRGISNESGVKILELIQESDAEVFEEKVSSTEAGKQGFDEVNLVKSYLSATELSNDLVLDPTLARGLSYYTGTIFEVESLETEMGSIAAGGRYADLTSLFGMPDMSGVGISFGAERIYDIMETLERFPAEISNTLQVLILPMDVESMPTSLMLSRQMRDQHISVDVYPGPAKMKKMMKYANGRSVPYVVIIGEDERNSNRYMLKQMQNGEQGAVSIEELLTIVK